MSSSDSVPRAVLEISMIGKHGASDDHYKRSESSPGGEEQLGAEKSARRPGNARPLGIVPAISYEGAKGEEVRNGPERGEQSGGGAGNTHRARADDAAMTEAPEIAESESDPRLAEILSLFGRGERDLLGFFMVEIFELIMEGGDQIAPVLGFASQGALRNIPHDSDAVWAYLRLGDIALCHGFIENHEERLKLERSFHEVRSWTLGLAHGVGRPKSGARRWSEVAAYAQRVCDKFPGLGTRTTIELS